ncbi:MAG: glycosyltransferase, partial [Ignavibacteriales bacterium]|nr:glycosyltransferase [Ignavibacteriales bacterium]
MNILHVLSQFEVTGAEAYTATLVAEQAQYGHRLFVVSDTLSLKMKAEYAQQPIGKRSYPQRIKNVVWLVRFIKDHQIHIVHAHSRAASWVCHLATRITGTPFISTVHGRQHVHFSSRAFSIYGKNIIAVCESVREHLIRDLGLHSAPIVVIPNGIELLRWEGDVAGPSRQELLGFHEDKKMLMFVGRLTGPKGDIVRFLLKEVLPLVLNKTRIALWIIGGMITPEDLPLLAKSLNTKYDEPTVLLKGFQKDLAHYITHADVVIGSGRVVPESLAMRKPVVAFGES